MLLAPLAAGLMISMFVFAGQAQAVSAPAPAQQVTGEGRGKGDEFEVYGRIESMPETGLVGAWIIDGADYSTDAETEFEQKHGAFDEGVCVKLHLKRNRTSVREMESKPDEACSRDDDDDDDDGREFYGMVEEMPESSPIGQWTISGGVYMVTDETEIKEKYGPIKVGTCVKVELTRDESSVRELQSKRAAYCSEDDDDDDGGLPFIGKGELYAQVVSLPDGFTPDDMTGEWIIGGISFTADENTEFQQRHGDFAVGALVKVEFRILEDGSFLAREIKMIITRDDGDDDDHDVRRRGKAFGIINDIPDGGLGIWLIGGIEYAVTGDTELDDKKGDLEEGRNVKVEYWQDEQGNRTAREIKAMPQRAGDKEGVYKLVGFVQSMPSEGFIGDWTIGGVDLVAAASSEFKEEHGMLIEGAYVEVKYVMQGSTRLIVKLETRVPPGGGDDDHYGRVERMDDGLATAAADGAWTVGGRNYVVTDATAVSSNLAVGSIAVVNSYLAADGSQVATRIDGITQDNRLYLPTAIK
jgi:hypothetical protein